MPDIKVPEIKIPDVKVPDIKVPDVPAFKAPKMPEMPDVKLPEAGMRELELETAEYTSSAAHHTLPYIHSKFNFTRQIRTKHNKNISQNKSKISNHKFYRTNNDSKISQK